ncbi:GtrA family protein, partial [Caproicibacterium lactatifermentans]
MATKEKIRVVWKYLTSREMILYIVFGLITTALNLAIYFVLTDIVLMDKSLAYFFAWLIAMLFAFVTNKKFVFESKARKLKAVLYELGTFTGGRLLTFAIGEILITVFVKQMGQS